MEHLFVTSQKTRPSRFACLIAGIGIPARMALAIVPIATEAQDNPENNVKQAETDPDYAVPDGTPDEIMEFVNELKDL